MDLPYTTSRSKQEEKKRIKERRRKQTIIDANFEDYRCKVDTCLHRGKVYNTAAKKVKESLLLSMALSRGWVNLAQ